MRVFDIGTTQHDAGNPAMGMVDVRDLSTNIPEDVTKLTRWGSGEISVVVHTRTVPISYNVKAWMIRSFLPSTAPRGETRAPRIYMINTHA